MAKFYDSLTERWYTMPEKAKPVEIFTPPEGIYERAARIVRTANIWDAVTATATATQMSTETEGGSQD